LQIKSLCEGLIASTIPERSRAVQRRDTALPKSGTQITLLTRSGMYVISEPPQSVMNAGLALMLELTQRAKDNRS